MTGGDLSVAALGGEPPDVVVDARGLRCPAPIIRLAGVAREAAPGTVLAVWWTDPAARHDIPAWARMRGHEVLGTIELSADEPGQSEPELAEPEPRATGATAWSTRVRLGG